MNHGLKYWAAGIIAVTAIVACFATGCGKKAPAPATPEASGTGQDAKQANDDADNQECTDDNNQSEDGEDNLHRYLLRQDEIMKDLIYNMKGIPKTGNASIDFLNGMILYYEAAIAISEGYLEYGGENKTLKELAEDTKTNQPGEIERMQGFIHKYEAEGHSDEDQENAYLDDYDKMLGEEHFMSKSGTDSLEHAFAERMMIHHQMATDMSKSILEYADYGEIRTLAQNILESQEEEVATMKEFIP